MPPRHAGAKQPSVLKTDIDLPPLPGFCDPTSPADPVPNLTRTHCPHSAKRQDSDLITPARDTTKLHGTRHGTTAEAARELPVGSGDLRTLGGRGEAWKPPRKIALDREAK